MEQTGAGLEGEPMADQTNNKLLWVALALCLLVPVVFVIVVQVRKHNQVVSPIPGGPPAPVVPQLPDLAAELREAKSLCEADGRAAKGQRTADIATGQRLYTEAKAK